MTPSTKKIILNDFPAFLLVVAGPVCWLLFIGAFFLGGLPSRTGEFYSFQDMRFLLLSMAVLVTAITVPLLLRRIEKYRELLTNGRDATGTITKIWFVKDRGRVEYDFEFQGQRLHGWNPIMKNKATQALREGDQVELAVDVNNPKRAAIKHLYVA